MEQTMKINKKQELQNKIIVLRLITILGFVYFYWIGYFTGKFTNIIIALIFCILFMILPPFLGLYLIRRNQE